MKSVARRSLLLAISGILSSTTAAQAYGPLGHEIVGAIADERLAGTPVAAKIAVLLDEFSLEKAAVIADEIKGWDKREWTIQDHSIIRRIAKLTGNCAISGGQISQCSIRIQLRLRIIGFTTPTFQWCLRKNIATARLVAANGTSST